MIQVRLNHAAQMRRMRDRNELRRMRALGDRRALMQAAVALLSGGALFVLAYLDLLPR